MELNFIELYEQTGLDLEDFADLLGVSFELVEKWYDGQETPEHSKSDQCSCEACDLVSSADRAIPIMPMVTAEIKKG